MWKETRWHCKGLLTLKLCTTLMAKLHITLMQSNDNWPHRRVATTSSTSTSNTLLPGVMNQSDLLELDDFTLQKVIGSKSKVWGASPFWIGLLVVQGKAWDYWGWYHNQKFTRQTKTGTKYTEKPAPPPPNVPGSTHLHPQRLPGALSKSLSPKQGEKTKQNKVLYIFSELVSQNHTRSYSNKPTRNERWQELQEDLHKQQWTCTKRLCNANPVETAEKLDGQDFWTKKPRLVLSKNLKIKTILTNPTCFDRRKGPATESSCFTTTTTHKTPEDLTWLLLPVFYLISQCLLELQGKSNLGKTMANPADDGEEPAAHRLAFQYKQSKITSVPEHKQDGKVIPQQTLITTYIVFHTIFVPEGQYQAALQLRFLNTAW